MRESADPDDEDYLLRELGHTVFRVRANPANPVRSAPGSPEEAVLAFVREHPGTTVTALWEGVPRLHAQDYPAVQRFVVAMIDEQTLLRAGKAPLELVDPVYERVPTCEVCGAVSDEHPILFWKYNTPVVRCPGCGLVYANPRWKADYLFDRYNDSAYRAEYDEKTTHAAAEPGRYEWWRWCLSMLAAGRPPGNLLDVGCATGEFLAAASREGWNPTGLEAAPHTAAEARQRSQVPVHIGTLDTAPWPDGSFDAVTLWDVIEHLQSPRAALNRIARLLRPGGMLGLSTPNIRSLSYALLGRNWPVVGPNEHIYYFAPRTLVRLLQETGFAVHHMRTHPTAARTWEQRLPPRLRSSAPQISARAHPFLNRFLLGDELIVFARRVVAI